MPSAHLLNCPPFFLSHTPVFFLHCVYHCLLLYNTCLFYIFPFLLCFLLLFFLQLFVRPPQTAILLFCMGNLNAGQEATVRTGHGTTDWFQIGKGVRQGYILSPCLFNSYAEYIMRNPGLDEAQAGIKIPGRNISRSEERRVGKEWKQWLTLFFGAPKSLQMVTAAMKSKDAYSLEGKL